MIAQLKNVNITIDAKYLSMAESKALLDGIILIHGVEMVLDHIMKRGVDVGHWVRRQNVEAKLTAETVPHDQCAFLRPSISECREMGVER